MRALTIRLIHEGENEQESYEFFNETLSPLLDHVECDVYIEDEGEATDQEVAERRGDC